MPLGPDFFARLLAQSPEEREERSRRIQAEYEVKQQALIAERSAQVQQLSALYDQLDDWEQGFVRTMKRYAQDFDLISRVQGGQLAGLSDGQRASLECLVSKYLAPQAQSRLQEPASASTEPEQGEPPPKPSFAQLCARPRSRG